MKKLYTFLGAALIAGSVSAQTYLTKDFETSLTNGGWTTQLPADTTDWYQSTFSGNGFAKISNYNGNANVVAEAWLISPAIDLTSATAPKLSFETVMKFAGPALQVMISMDYDGSSDPTAQGTWTDISSMCTLDTDDAAWGNFNTQSSGNVDITAYMSTTTYVAFIYTGTATEGSTWEIDNVLVNEGGGTGGTATPASVYDIQYSTATPADSPFTGQIVATGGIVTYVRGDGKYYIQSGNGAYSGVYVFDDAHTVAIGDSLTFDAEVDEYYDLTELKNVTNFVNVNSGNFFMSSSVSTADMGTEAYEGVLIATCGTVTAVDQFDNFTFNDGSGNAVGDPYVAGYHASGSNINAPTVGTTIVVKGIVDYSFSEFKVLARSAGDITATAQCVVGINENITVFNMYPNPTEGILNIEVEGNNAISIVDARGSVVRTIQSNDFTTLDVSDLASGMYFLKVNNTTKRFVVK